VTGAPSAAEIAGLLAWARRLSDARGRRDPAGHAAFHTAKTDLLARIAPATPTPASRTDT
jgi:hypothetical protein